MKTKNIEKIKEFYYAIEREKEEWKDMFVWEFVNAASRYKKYFYVKC